VPFYLSWLYRHVSADVFFIKINFVENTLLSVTVQLLQLPMSGCSTFKKWQLKTQKRGSNMIAAEVKRS
jgi:hypothetical protein